MKTTVAQFLSDNLVGKEVYLYKITPKKINYITYYLSDPIDFQPDGKHELVIGKITKLEVEYEHFESDSITIRLVLEDGTNVHTDLETIACEIEFV